ncbi:MAG: hypothetical protein H6662_00145 [Ardenticatenaceae bacterium]|nr:hypothetical protein [Anaerolineales bacterium]MCB8919965.1 hypothetical protein [Ardenticatenaceae bacterium]MCB8989812.1 hypothetical protein [Ardenticatenaceae bacterium]
MLTKNRIPKKFYAVSIFLLGTITIFSIFTWYESSSKPSLDELLESNSPSCQYPCWQNITPSVTSVEEGINSISRLTFISGEDSINHYPQSSLYAFRFSPGNVGRIYYEKETITSVYLSLLSMGSLSDALSILGVPKWIVIDFDEGNLIYVAYLFFPDKGTVIRGISIYEEDEKFQLNTASGSSEASIYPEMRLDGLWFYNDSSDDTASEILQEKLSNSTEWTDSQEPIANDWTSYGFYIRVP